MKLLFVNAQVHTIICAMNKNTKIIFSQNLSPVIKPTHFPGDIYQGTLVKFAQAWKQWLKIECSDCTLFPVRGDLDRQYLGKLFQKSVLVK